MHLVSMSLSLYVEICLSPIVTISEVASVAGILLLICMKYPLPIQNPQFYLIMKCQMWLPKMGQQINCDDLFHLEFF
jgi:hypothetical protein